MREAWGAGRGVRKRELWLEFKMKLKIKLKKNLPANFNLLSILHLLWFSHSTLSWQVL